MRSSRKKGIGLLLAIVMMLSLLSACSNSNGGTNKSDTADTNLAEGSSKPTEIQFYMLGNAPKDLPTIEAEINKMALEDLNVKVKFNYTTWTDWDQKYKLLLSTGRAVDLIFTADWVQYQQYAKKGAFTALDELLPLAAPELQSFVPQEMWDAVRVDGKIYTIPSTYKEYVTGGFVWREDLRKKYDLPTPVDIPTFEAYLAGIKQHEPTIQPVAFGASVENSIQYAYLEFQRKEVGAMPYGMFASYANPRAIVSYWGSAEHLEDLKKYRSWAELGYFSKNELNDPESIQERIINGSAASLLSDNPTRYNAMLSSMQSQHPDWDLGYTPFGRTNGYATPVHPIHNGFAIPAGSQHPEQALAFYEKLVTDKRYNLLTQYGIEGVNYTVENGYYKQVGDVSSNGFPREAMSGWAWRNPAYMLFEPTYDRVQQIFNELDKVQKPDIYTGFIEDYSEYQAERAALEQVVKQYLYPLLAGQIDDVQAGLSLFMEKAQQAGLDKIQQSYKKQWVAYLEKKGIQ
ncbi:putative aldouronate transport system substrate-binding protein [Paenibacillus cellulosilyticus]|uniref:Putative aldouronate transport system substrate-binding protein n=1 Tax=Paenibacillus cellulosilyticus TaxID=375489 RepID=A0A2V2YTD6_9BACL|nr:extracellular solute-binding protein [Paenibacillus cellulosilyticus]PWW00977.1 putative aldouronate transport system substrate-binding protein [Paenibacillus cellulosilyticus]QKS47620.1 extracellular solute-binding protein [Paenibacillus cellulosilyticus]